MANSTHSSSNFAIEDAIAKFNLEEFLQEYNLDYTLSGNQYYCPCPSCGQGDQKFYISPKTKLFICFKCGVKGNLFQFVALVTGEPVKVVFARLLSRICFIPMAEVEKLSVNIVGSTYPIVTETEILSEITMPTKWEPLFMVDGEVADYAEQRGISKAIAKRFDLRAAPDAKRLVFPVYDRYQRLVGWIGRDVTGKNPRKYLNSPGLRKSYLLYGGHLCAEAESIVIAEGPIDALKAWRHNSVALMGKTIARQQMLLLYAMQNLKRVYLALDPEETRQTKMELRKLLPFWEVRVLNYDSDADLGDRDEEDIGRLVDAASSQRSHLKLEMDLHL